MGKHDKKIKRNDSVGKRAEQAKGISEAFRDRTEDESRHVGEIPTDDSPTPGK